MALIAAHRGGLRALADEQDDHRYAERQLALRDIEREMDVLRPVVDMMGFRIAQEKLDERNTHLGQLAQRRGELLYLAAEEAVEAFIHEHLIPAYAAAIRIRGVVDLLGRAIEARGYGTNASPVALRIGGAILRRVAEVIPAITVAGDRVAAEQFLVRLGEDPTAELGPPTYQAEWSLEIRTMTGPLPDGSVHINRESPTEPAESVLSDLAAVPVPESESASVAPPPSPADDVPGPTFAPMPDVTLPPWLDTGGLSFRPPLVR
jgi:hypothetical protein